MWREEYRFISFLGMTDKRENAYQYRLTRSITREGWVAMRQSTDLVVLGQLRLRHGLGARGGRTGSDGRALDRRDGIRGNLISDRLKVTTQLGGTDGRANS
jgi:hypothetical protein